jgi:hypothetical protein
MMNRVIRTEKSHVTVNKTALQNLILIIIILSTIVFLYYLYNYFYDDVIITKSKIDGKHYHVRSTPIEVTEAPKVDTFVSTEVVSTNDAELAANFLATVNQKINTLVDYMYINQLPSIEVSQRLKNRWKSCTLRETNSNEKSIAYTVNKGEEMRVCIRKDGQLEDMNTTIFVILHELGHIMSVSFGHNLEYTNNFNYVVHLASSMGIYKPQDFHNEPVNYCGTNINTTPCSDGTCAIAK